MTSDHAFGSDELSPELLRSATFDEQDGRVDAAEVRQFLDRVASSLEVFMSQDAPTALRAEFSRNAEIAQQVLDAGQNAAEQLRRQAAEEAKRILDEAREATLGLRETVEGEIEQAREQVEAMRGTFIQDLRDLYDRIGASLYRFERAAEETGTTPIQEPSRAPQHEPRAEPARRATPDDVDQDRPAHDEAAPADEPAGTGEPELPEGAKPPAWRQLPPEAWSTPAGELQPEAVPAAAEPAAPVPEPELPPVASQAAPAQPTATTAPPVAAAEPEPVAPQAGSDPFAVVEDEPLAPGEPLVDLRELASANPPAPSSLDAENPATPPPAGQAGGSWLDAPGTPATAPAATEQHPAADDGLGGSWLDASAAPPVADVARDDALAEALIAGTPAGQEAPAAPGAVPAAATPPSPQPGDATPAVQAASPDATAVRQQILDLLAAGHSRENVEAYLSQQLGLLNPGALVDAALGPQS